MADVFNSSNSFGGFITSPDGSVYKQTNHTYSSLESFGVNGSGMVTQNWTTLDLVSGPVPGTQGTATSTGVNPVETSYSLFGHTVPLTVLGLARIGGEIIAGPYINNGLATFCISLGVPADPTGTRDIREIAFDSEVVWSTSGASGVTTSAGGTFSTEAFTFRFYQGTLTQSADAIETLHWGANAVAYRPQILIWFEDLPIANTKFSKIPYVSAVIGDGSGDDVNLGEAFERLAASPFVEFPDFEAVGITDGLPDGGLIFAQDIDFLTSIQQFGRFFRTWDILQTDKLRIVDRGSDLTADITLDKSRLMGSITVNRQGNDTVSKDLELSTIDKDADYTIVPYLAQRPSDPIPVTTSVGKDTAYLPAVMDAFTRASLATLALYHGEATRKTITGTAMAFGMEMEPGDLIRVSDLGDDFRGETYKVIETLHGANCSVEFTAESILNCTRSVDADVEFIAASDSAYDTNTTLDQTIPALTEEGDLLIALVMHRSALTPPAGWTFVASEDCANDVTSQTTSVYKRVAEIGDAGDTTTWTQASSVRMGIHIITLRNDGGCDVLDFATASQSLDTTASNFGDMAEVTASANGQMGIALASTMVANAGVGAFNYTVYEAHPDAWTLSTSNFAETHRTAAAYQTLNSGDTTAGQFENDVPGTTNNGWACVSIIVG